MNKQLLNQDIQTDGKGGIACASSATYLDGRISNPHCHQFRINSAILKSFWRGSILLSLLLVLCLFLPGTWSAAQLPEPTNELYVLDQAKVMSNETRSMILNTSQELARLTKAQVAVVTIKTLDDQPLEEVSLGILRKWGLGDKKLNNGVLILLVTEDRRAKIEVGYGLEGALTDGKTGRIQDEYMLPYYKKGDYDSGLRNGYAAIVQEVAKEYEVNLAVNPAQQAPSSEPVNNEDNLPSWVKILGIVFILILIWLDYRFLNGFIFGFLLGMIFRGGGGGGGGFGGGGSSGGGGSGGGGGSSRGW